MLNKIQAPSSKFTFSALLVSSLLLTACGGSSSSNNNAGTPQGAGTDYSGKTSAATELPSTEEGKTELVNAIAQVLKVKNMPLYRAYEFGDDIAEYEVTCTEGSTDYKAKIEEDFDANETYEDVVKADVSFNQCTGKLLYSYTDKTFNGELHFNADETETSATDTYLFKQLSIQDSASANNTYVFDGQYVQKYVLNNADNIDVTQSWNFKLSYTDPSGTIDVTTKGKQTYEVDFEEDENVTEPKYQGSFSLAGKTYQLTYTDPKMGFDNKQEDVKFYHPELGYYALDISSMSGKFCTKDGKAYSGLGGNVLIKDNTGASLLNITLGCETPTFQ